MFRKASETVHALSFYGIVNDTLVPLAFYLRLASSSFSTSQHLSSARLTVLLSAFYLSPLFFHYLFIFYGPTFPFCLYCVFLWRLRRLGFDSYKVQMCSLEKQQVSVPPVFAS